MRTGSVGVISFTIFAAFPCKGAAPLPYTLEDSLNWQSFLSLADGAQGQPVYSLDSPNGRYTVFGTIGSNPAGEVLQKIYAVDHVDAVKKNGAPRIRLLYELPLGKRSHRVSDIRWIDNTRFAMLAEDDSGVTQIAEASSTGAPVRYLTTSVNDVVSFAIRNEMVVYYAKAPARDLPSVLNFSKGVLTEALFWEMGQTTYQSQVQAFAKKGSGDPIKIGPVSAIRQRGIWISPSGKYAVMLIPSVAPPEQWSRYELSAGYGFAGAGPWIRPTDFAPAMHPRYAIANLWTGAVKPLLNAPLGWLAGDNKILAIWSKDERSVVVSNALLPIAPSNALVRRPTSQPAIVRAEVTSGAYGVLFNEPYSQYIDGVSVRRQSEYVTEVLPYAKSGLLGVQMRRSDGAVTVRTIDAGVELDSVAGASKPATRIVVEESISVPPRLVSYSRGVRHVIFDPNTWTQTRQLGKLSEITWSSSEGIKWRGLLLLPEARRKGKIPLVVQTHGYSRSRFFRDGSNGSELAISGYVARPLASSGIAVLQVEDNVEAAKDIRREVDRYADGYISGIEYLAKAGIIDRRRVGLQAFSRTGSAVLKVMVKKPGLIAAVALNDVSHPAGYVNSIMTYNIDPSMVAQERALIGGSPAFSDFGAWRSSEFYRAFSGQVPVRIDAMDRISLLDIWEAFVRLKQAGAPVDLNYYPYGEHNLIRTEERRASQGGNLDWFRFWLLDFEDRAPSKVDQYKLWRSFRGAEAQASRSGK